MDKEKLNDQKQETKEWLEALQYISETDGQDRVIEILRELQVHAFSMGVKIPLERDTPYINTIGMNEQLPYPGDLELEHRIRSYIRWNAMAMIVKANESESGIGGHIATFASSATLYETGFNHFFRNRTADYGGDSIYIQGHASPGIYSRAFLEGRLTKENMKAFRRELQPNKTGLSSYPHPRLMPDFWEYSTVSMGLGPIQAVYQARFMKYLEDRGLKPRNGGKIWAFVGDGETAEPETLGAISLASREKLDNLVFVINCNLQGLDGPVRGNGKIIQELSSLFRGCGWNVIKVIWGSKWDALLEKDTQGLLIRRMEEVVDGDYQKYVTGGGSYIREHFFSKYPELLDMVKHMSDKDLETLNRGGHDPLKVYSAFKNASETVGAPSVVLAKTIKGYGMGNSGEALNITHSQKKLNEKDLIRFRDRFNIPVPDNMMHKVPFYIPAEDSQEIKYLHNRRQALGGYLPSRVDNSIELKLPKNELYKEFYLGSGDREVSTTMGFIRLISKLLKDKDVGKYIVPIIPDEARTFGAESLFQQCGIYSSSGQLYEPVDKGHLMYYKESKEGQLLQEGINEAGAMSSFIAAATSYTSFGVPMIPFYIYYSMFGFQRVADLIWAASDMLSKGFLIGGTAGRTTLNGEGLQHQDGHSHLIASTNPGIRSYDIAFSYECAVIVQEGMRVMYKQKESVIYYLTIGNENYKMPPMPKGVENGIIKGIYRFKQDKTKSDLKVHLIGSGSIIHSAIEAAKILKEKFNIIADIWCVTSYNELRREALNIERNNLLQPLKPKKAFITQVFEKENGILVFASDYMKAHSDLLANWLPLPFISLGTDGFGMSETRENLRNHFEVDAKHMAWSSIVGLFREKKITDAKLIEAKKILKIKSDKLNPLNT